MINFSLLTRITASKRMCMVLLSINNQYKKQSLIFTFGLLSILLVLLDLLGRLDFFHFIIVFFIVFFLFSLILLLFSEVEEEGIGIAILKFSGNIEKFMEVSGTVEEKGEERMFNFLFFVLELFLNCTDRLFCLEIHFAFNFKIHVAEVVRLC